MSEAAIEHHEHHDPHLAHHFDTPSQQYASAKLGMWVFLGTELLMFGGLFCAYAVFRYSHPDVFVFGHEWLDARLGGINTLVLIASSFTMALGVRCAQLGQRNALVICLILTLLGGAIFMVIKTVEYETKWKHHLFPGKYNVFNPENKSGAEKPEKAEHGESAVVPVFAPATRPVQLGYVDPLAGTADEPRVKAPTTTFAGLSPRQSIGEQELTYSELDPLDRSRVSTFFSVYFCMTGLHGLHVLIGMGLITWILVRGAKNEFGPKYFTPVDLVGLYWHLVDLIWIFLFPLLYLIH